MLYISDETIDRWYHGHLCMGMVLGVRMARLGMKKLGIEDPLSFRDTKHLFMSGQLIQICPWNKISFTNRNEIEPLFRYLYRVHSELKPYRHEALADAWL